MHACMYVCVLSMHACVCSMQLSSLSRPRERIAELERALWTAHEGAQALQAAVAGKEGEAQELRDKVRERDEPHVLSNMYLETPSI